MEIRTKSKVIIFLIIAMLLISGIIYFRFFFLYEERVVIGRKSVSITGMNLTVTIFGCDGKIVKRWKNVNKITSGRAPDGSTERYYTSFFTRDRKYVQIPNSVWYVAEEE